MNMKNTINKIENEVLARTDSDRIFAARCLVRHMMGKPDIYAPFVGVPGTLPQTEAIEMTQRYYPDVSEYLLTVFFSGQLKTAEEGYINRMNNHCLTATLEDVRDHYVRTIEAKDSKTGEVVFPTDKYDDLKLTLAECYPNVEREAILNL